ncbi:MAG TPA: aminotransferase class IV [Burkholderiaceae bacterium]|nr:aminotransferase class IV [Burkholderiaceae bacterium]
MPACPRPGAPRPASAALRRPRRRRASSCTVAASAALSQLAELAARVEEALPQTQCTRCGYPDCRGYAEAIALDVNGYVSEGSGENLFLVVKGEIITTPLHNSILAGITRASVLQLARELGYSVKEMVVPRELLYVADEAFFTGTAVEVTPVTAVDRLPVGTGDVGPVTKAIQQAFFGIVKGDLPDRHGWLTKVPRTVGATAR